MIVHLTDISQGVSLDGKGTQVNRLHFKMDTGEAFSIQVPRESLEELLRNVFGKVTEEAASEAPPDMTPEPTDDATSFGGEDYEPTGEDASVEEQAFRRAPQSEADVPSL